MGRRGSICSLLLTACRGGVRCGHEGYLKFEISDFRERVMEVKIVDLVDSVDIVDRMDNGGGGGQVTKRLLEEKSGSEVRFTPSFLKPASSPVVGI